LGREENYVPGSSRKCQEWNAGPTDMDLVSADTEREAGREEIAAARLCWTWPIDARREK